MRKILLAGFATLALAACQNSGSSTSTPTGTLAATPQQACGSTIPSQYCTSYNPGAYGYSSLSYGNYGYGYYGTSGFAGYGCPVGYQPLYMGSTYGYGYGTYGNYGSSAYTCVATNYFNGYSSGYTPYYAYGQRWANNHMGHGPAQACTVGTACPQGNCLAFAGSNLGYCAR